MLFDRATNGERLISGSDAAADGRHRSDQSPFRAFLLGRRLCDATQELYNVINTQGDAPPEVRFATASLVEGAGFESPIGGKGPIFFPYAGARGRAKKLAKAAGCLVYSLTPGVLGRHLGRRNDSKSRVFGDSAAFCVSKCLKRRERERSRAAA
jgi:hypothetical protein